MSSTVSTYPVIKGTLISTENYTWNTADSLGKGASAMVYLGRQKFQGKLVAVKVFHEHHAQKSDYLRELELLKRLKHDNIIQSIGMETMTNKKQVLIMEYCEGGSLHHMLDQPSYVYGLSEEEYILVLCHVSGGMAYLRGENVIHRDIKPGNIMRFIREDGFSVYKLTDFGAARNLDEDESFQSLYGTEEYLHPGIYERAVLRLPTAQSFDARVDLWSLGVTFYHTATGQLPFQPYGGRSNRHTMFEIITQKETGVISGVQTFEKGPIRWERDLPETSQLSSGLRSIVTPLLAGLMEPDASKMITYDSFFRIVSNLKQKIVISVFHYTRGEDLKIYADTTATFTSFQDQIALMTDIAAAEQILLVGGKCLEDVIDPALTLKDFPPHLLHGSIYLFPKEMSELCRINKPAIPDFPDIVPYSDMDADSRIAHMCSARGELIKRNSEKICQQQERLLDGILCLRVYVESRLTATKSSLEFTKQLIDECCKHSHTFFAMTAFLRDFIVTTDHSQSTVKILNKILADNVISQVQAKAKDRMAEIEQYRDMLSKKLEDVKAFANYFTAKCQEEHCYKKVQHYMTVISAVYSRFRRDKSVKNQMTPHDENIHNFEKQKLQSQCVTMKSHLQGCCIPTLERVFKKGSSIAESLTKCLSRVAKIEKNIKSVQNCEQLLSEKLIKLRESCYAELKNLTESGFVSAPISTEAIKEENETTAEPSEVAGARSSDKTSLGSGSNPVGAEAGRSLSPSFFEGTHSMSRETEKLDKKLGELQELLKENSSLLRSMEDPLQSTGSLTRRMNAMYLNELGGNT